MATPEATTVRPPAKTAPKATGRRTTKPSAMPLFLLTAAVAVGIHVLFCLGMAAYTSQTIWHPFGIDATVMIPSGDGSMQQFYINPILSFIPFDILFGFMGAVSIGFMIRMPFFRDRVHHTVLDIKKRLMLQLTASAEEVESIIKNDPDNNARLLMRRDDINIESVQSEIKAINSAQAYITGKGSWLSGLNTYMRFHFVEEYSNKVQGMAYGGAAFLIIVVGIRGLKFIPANKPSFILFALGVEFTMLVLLATTMVFTEEEERTDRILKQMVDAVKGGKKKPMEALAQPEEPQLSRADYEAMVRQQMDKKILEVMANKDDDALRRIALDLVAKG